MHKYEVVTKKGFGQVKFGMSRDEVKKILGKPDEEVQQRYSDEMDVYFWEYYEEGLSLSFDEEDDFLLGMVSFADENYKIGNVQYIGKTLIEMQQAATKLGITDLELDSELSDEESQSYYSEEQGLTFNVMDGEVTDFTILSDADEDGNPVWPK
jgi:hypothetical protein